MVLRPNTFAGKWETRFPLARTQLNHTI